MPSEFCDLNVMEISRDIDSNMFAQRRLENDKIRLSLSIQSESGDWIINDLYIFSKINGQKLEFSRVVTFAQFNIYYVQLEFNEEIISNAGSMPAGFFVPEERIFSSIYQMC